MLLLLSVVCLPTLEAQTVKLWSNGTVKYSILAEELDSISFFEWPEKLPDDNNVTTEDNNVATEDYIVNFSTISGLSTVPGDFNSGVSGVYRYALEDASCAVDVFTYTSDPYTPYAIYEGWSEASSSVNVWKLYESWYGGILPTLFPAQSTEDFLTPACQKYHTGETALICNPGLICRAIFGKHIVADHTTLTTTETIGKLKGLWVAPTTEMSYVDPVIFNEDKQIYDLSDLEINALPANHRIEFVLYAYKPNDSAIKTFLNSLKTSLPGEGGVLVATAVLASSDADGKVTVNKNWQYVDASGTEGNFWEVVLRVVDKDGRESYSYELSDENMTNYCLIDDITYERASE